MKKLIFGAILPLFVPFILATPALAGDVQYDLQLEGITCPFCVATSERALRKIDGVKKVSGDLETGIIRVCAEDRVKFSDDQLTKIFLSKGFTYKGMTIYENCDQFDNLDVLSEEELERRAAIHDTMGHGEDLDFLGIHDHDGDGKPDHPADAHIDHDHDGDGTPDHEVDHDQNDS